MTFKPDWDNLDDFLGDFTTTATITPFGQSPRQVPCIFDDPFYSADLGEYVEDTSQPRITAKESDLAGMKRKDPVQVNGVTYHALKSPEGDGTGMAVLRLALEG
jgi:hypothetical protein